MKIKSLIMLTLLVISSSVVSGQSYNYWTGYDGDGLPNAPWPIFQRLGWVPPQIETAIVPLLIEGNHVDISDTDVFMLNYDPPESFFDGHVFITFVHESAAYQNSLGFYTYKGTPPTTTAGIDTIIFPNVDGSVLTRGDILYLGKWDTGTKFGWFVVSDGWDDEDDIVIEKSGSNKGTQYSTPTLNGGNVQCVYLEVPPIPTPILDINLILLAFEDIPLNSSKCDEDYNDVIFYISTTSDYSLPVELSSFKGKLNGGTTNLLWITGSECDNRGFILERKENDNNWVTIASYLNSYSLVGAGNTSEQTEYTFTDFEIKSGNTYSYRLTDVSEDGKKTVHQDNIVEVEYMDQLSNAETFTISNVYPNPFNPSTTIEFSIPEKQNVKVNIFDMQGKMVSELYNGMKNSGSHKIGWNASDYPSGVYFVHLTNGQKLSIQKCIFLK